MSFVPVGSNEGLLVLMRLVNRHLTRVDIQVALRPPANAEIPDQGS